MAEGRRVEQLPELVSARLPNETDISYRTRVLDTILFTEIMYLIRADGADRQIGLDALRMAMTPTGQTILQAIEAASSETRRLFQSDWTEEDDSKFTFIQNKASSGLGGGVADESTILGQGTEIDPFRVAIPFTQAFYSKLAGITAGATPPQTSSEIRDRLAALSGINRLSAHHIRDLPSGGSPFDLPLSAEADVSTAAENTWYDTGVAVPSGGNYITISFGSREIWVKRSDIADLTTFETSETPTASQYKIFPRSAQDGKDIRIGHNAAGNFLICVVSASASLTNSDIDARIAPPARANNPTGTFADARLPSTIARTNQLKTNSDIDARIATPARANSPSGTFATARIPDLAASKITSGTLGDARIPSLNASKVNAGTFGTARIPSLNADKINAGTLGTDRIPDLAASKITSGTLGDARIPNLAASKVTSGVFASARIPSMNASKITSGTIEPTRIPNLNASKITAGTLAAARVPFAAQVSSAERTAGTATAIRRFSPADVKSMIDTHGGSSPKIAVVKNANNLSLTTSGSGTVLGAAKLENLATGDIIKITVSVIFSWNVASGGGSEALVGINLAHGAATTITSGAGGLGEMWIGVESDGDSNRDEADIPYCFVVTHTITSSQTGTRYFGARARKAHSGDSTVASERFILAENLGQ